MQYRLCCTGDDPRGMPEGQHQPGGNINDVALSLMGLQSVKIQSNIHSTHTPEHKVPKIRISGTEYIGLGKGKVEKNYSIETTSEYKRKKKFGKYQSEGKWCSGCKL